MASKLKTLLIAGMALPFAATIALAQSAPQSGATTTAPSTAAPAPTAAATPDRIETGKTAKQPGAMKMTPAEKKAAHDKAGTQHVVRKHPDEQKAGAVTGKAKTVAGSTAAPQKPAATGTDTPAKKL